MQWVVSFLAIVMIGCGVGVLEDPNPHSTGSVSGDTLAGGDAVGTPGDAVGGGDTRGSGDSGRGDLRMGGDTRGGDESGGDGVVGGDVTVGGDESRGGDAVGGDDNGPQTRPNVVLFLVDDMGWTDWQRHPQLNPTGSIVYETPNMHRLADEGVTFGHGYSSAPVCSPTRASIMTGKTTARTHISQWIVSDDTWQQTLQTANLKQPPDWQRNLLASEVTVAEAFQSAGYATGFVGKWHMGRKEDPGGNPLNHGFDTDVGSANANGSGNSYNLDSHFAGSDGAWAGMTGLEEPGSFAPDAYLADVLTDAAEDFVEHRHGEPFFLLLSQHVPHQPIEAPQNLVDKYTAKIATLQSQGRNLKGHTSPVYAGMIESMDDSLGRILDRLDDPNDDGSTADSIRDNTIIVFASDNGGLLRVDSRPDRPYATRNLPLRDGKGSLYEGGVRVPFLVSWTGNGAIAQGTVSTARTSSHDIYPTLLEMTGVAGDPAHNASMDGVSIVEAIEGLPFTRPWQFWHYPHMSPQDYSRYVVGGRFVSAVRQGAWKLLYYYDNQQFALYQTDGDIGETTNLMGASRRAERVAHELSQALHDHLQAAGAQTPINKSTNQPVALPPVLPAQPIALDGPTAHFGLDETNGTVIADSSGNGNHGALTGGTNVTLGQPGVSGSAIGFDGGGVRILDGTTDLRIEGNNARTISLWFSAAQIDACLQRMVGISDWVNQSGNPTIFDIVLEEVDGDAMVGVRYGNGNSFYLDEQDQPFQVGEWYHVAFVYDGTFLDFDETDDADLLGLSVFVNGVQVDSDGGNHNNAGQFLETGDPDGGSVANDVTIGRAHRSVPCYFFRGSIDEVRIHETALALHQIQELFDNP
ncbi:sulfatase-like hydrolase/transferase [Myxococcota bacterium]